TDAILHVLRCFDNDNIVHVDGSVNPIRDKETIDMELQLKDLETVDKKLEKVKRAAKTGNKDAQKEEAVLLKIKTGLEAGTSIRALEFTEDEYEDFVKPSQFITDKPVMYLCNVDEASAVSGNKYVDLVREAVKNENAAVLLLAVRPVADTTDLDDNDGPQMFLQDICLVETGPFKLRRTAVKLLKQKSYCTASVKEVRALTFDVGETAPQAAGVIHTD